MPQAFFLDHPNCAINSEYSIPQPPQSLPIKRKKPMNLLWIRNKIRTLCKSLFSAAINMYKCGCACVLTDAHTHPVVLASARVRVRSICASRARQARSELDALYHQAWLQKKCWPAKTNKQTNLLNDTTTTMIVTWFYHTKNMITSPINRWKPIKNEKKQQCYTHYTQHTTRYTRIHNTHYYMNIYNCDCEEMINY